MPHRVVRRRLASRQRGAGARAQSGAAAVFVAISLVATIAALALALDLGRLYFEHRDLQRLANMAALDAARAASGCLGDVEDRQAAAQVEAQASVVRNGGRPTDVASGSVLTGRETDAAGVRDFVADSSEAADSVQVSLQRPMPSRLIPLWSSGEGGGVLVVRAVGTLKPIVSLDVRSSLANLNEGVLNQLLSQMLGGPISINVLSYRGLFDASVSLGDIEAAAGVGTLEQFLDTEISVPDFLNILADALSATTNAAVRATVQTLAATADASRTVLPSDVLGLREGAEQSATEALVNVGALVTALSQAAVGGDNLINLSLPVNLGPILQSSVRIKLVERARPAIGPAGPSEAPSTFASNTQANIDASLQLNLGLLGTVNVGVYLKAAEAGGEVTGIECARRGQPEHVVAVNAWTRAASIGIGRFEDINAPNPVPMPLTVANILGVSVSLQMDPVPLGDDEEQPLEFEGPFPSDPAMLGTPVDEAVSGALQGLAANINPDALQLSPPIPVVGPLLTSLSTLVSGLQNAIVGPLAEEVLTPVLEGLGVGVGAAEVRVLSVTGDRAELFVREP